MSGMPGLTALMIVVEDYRPEIGSVHVLHLQEVDRPAPERTPKINNVTWNLAQVGNESCYCFRIFAAF